MRDTWGKELTDLWEVHIIELTKALQGTPVDDWIRLFNAREEADLAMIAVKNEGMAEAIRMVKNMSIRKSLRWLYDDYWKAKRDRWAEDDYIRDEGIAIGRKEGMKEGMSASILTLLENMGEVPADLREKIVSQQDKTVLEQWLLSASEAQNIEQFRQKENL
ncbi:MAG: PD-(D/E)XK nuclease family transposase [Lachnospiraceae bacterium]|nr:PD-(D/E)XK nuclease family transposase [Lachnospiraceae bacterium]